MKQTFSSVADIFKSRPIVKPPAYPWQDLALRIIKELTVPNFKRSAIFKICKEKSATEIERAVNDTKELCQSGDKWKYFLKVIDKGQTNVPFKKQTYGKIFTNHH